MSSCCGGKSKNHPKILTKDINQELIFANMFRIQNQEVIVNVFEHCLTISSIQKQHVVQCFVEFSHDIVFDEIRESALTSASALFLQSKSQQNQRATQSKPLDYSPNFKKNIQSNNAEKKQKDEEEDEDSDEIEENLSEKIAGVRLMWLKSEDSRDSMTIDIKRSLNLSKESEYAVTELIQVLSQKLSKFNFKQHYKIVKELGQGASSVVYLVIHRKTKQKYAAKISNKLVLENDKNGIEGVLQEIDLLKELNNPQILQLKDHFQDTTHIYIVTDLMFGGTLKNKVLNLVQQQSSISSTSEIRQHGIQFIQQVMSQILMGLTYIHQNKIMHRDIKPDNILFSSQSNLNLVISDFGIATKTDVREYLFQRAGTPGYCPPEVFKSKSRTKYSDACDLYSLGIIFYELLFQSHPFTSVEDHEKYMKSGQALFQYKDVNIKTSKYGSTQAMDLLTQMVDLNPKKRITAAKALQHPFFIEVDFADLTSVRTMSDRPSNENNGLDMKKLQMSEMSKNSHMPYKQSTQPFNNDNIEMSTEFIQLRNPMINYNLLKDKSMFLQSIALPAVGGQLKNNLTNNVNSNNKSKMDQNSESNEQKIKLNSLFNDIVSQNSERDIKLNKTLGLGQKFTTGNQVWEDSFQLIESPHKKRTVVSFKSNNNHTCLQNVITESVDMDKQGDVYVQRDPKNYNYGENFTDIELDEYYQGQSYVKNINKDYNYMYHSVFNSNFKSNNLASQLNTSKPLK